MTAAQTTTSRATRPATRPIGRTLEWLETDELWARRDTPHGREELVHRFLPLARRLASRYRSPHEPVEDLVQVASLALLRAIDRFDPGRGSPFVSFAVPTILGELKRHFRGTAWSAHVPRGAQELALRVDHATRELTGRTGRSPRIEAIADYLDVDVEDVLVGLEAGNAHYSTSLDGPAGTADDYEDDPQALVDTVGSEDPGIDRVEAAVSLAAAFRRLPYLERRALTLRLGGDMKQMEIARQMGCSQMQISRLLRRAAERLQAETDPGRSPTRVQ